MFKQDIFPMIVFEAGQLEYWTGEVTSHEIFFPRLVNIESKWEEHSVLVRGTVGSPLTADEYSGWREQCLRYFLALSFC